MARNYFQRMDQLCADCALGNDDDVDALTAQTAGNETISAQVAQGANVNTNVEFSAVQVSGEIGGEDLPASSQFDAQLDITAIGGNLSVRVVFHAYDSG